MCYLEIMILFIGIFFEFSGFILLKYWLPPPVLYFGVFSICLLREAWDCFHNLLFPCPAGPATVGGVPSALRHFWMCHPIISNIS